MLLVQKFLIKQLLFCVFGVSGLGNAFTLSGDSISGVNDFSDICGVLALTPVNQHFQTVQKTCIKSVVISCYY